MVFDFVLAFVYTRKGQLKSEVLLELKMNYDVRIGVHDAKQNVFVIQAIVYPLSIHIYL